MRAENTDPITLKTEVVAGAFRVTIGHSEPLSEGELLSVSWGEKLDPAPIPSGLLLGHGVYAGRVRPSGPIKLKFEDEEGKKHDIEVPFSVFMAVTRAVVAAEVHAKMQKAFDEHVAYKYFVGETVPVEASKKTA